MKRMFQVEFFEEEQAARAYIKSRRLRKYSLRHDESEGRWTVSHVIYI